MDQSGTVIGTTTLGQGMAAFAWNLPTNGGIHPDFCVFPFTVQLPSATFYEFQVGQWTKTMPTSQVHCVTSTDSILNNAPGEVCSSATGILGGPGSPSYTDLEVDLP